MNLSPPNEGGLSPDEEAHERHVGKMIMAKYGLGNVPTMLIMVATSGGLFYLCRNRGFALKIIVPPMVGMTVGTGVSGLTFIVSMICILVVVGRRIKGRATNFGAGQDGPHFYGVFKGKTLGNS